MERSTDSAWMLVIALLALLVSIPFWLIPPLVLILPAGLFPYDGKAVRFCLPLTLVGWGVSLFQVLLVAGFIPERITPCAQGVPCSEVQVEWFGFLNIPLLSFLAFSAMNALLIAAHFRRNQ